MPYQAGARLPGEGASKLGHLSVVQSKWVKSLVDAFETQTSDDIDGHQSLWASVQKGKHAPLRSIWAVDGSYVSVSSNGVVPREVSFVKTALLTVDKAKLDVIDKSHPHPLLLRDILRDSAVFHATVFPLKNIRTPLGSNYNAVRNIIHDSMQIDEDGAFYETLKWISYQKWQAGNSRSPGFQCPHCQNSNDTHLPFDAIEAPCEHCGKTTFLTDMLGFHLDMSEDTAPESVASSYMLIMEHLMLFTAIRLLWGHSDKSLASDTLFIKDGPLTLRSQYSKIVPNIRNFFEYSKAQSRAIHVVGQEKTGAFKDHLDSISRQVAPHARGEPIAYMPLSHDYVRREVHRTPDLASPYGKRTNWGEKLYVKVDPATALVLCVPVGEYQDHGAFPNAANMIGLDRILATIPEIISHKFEGALFPIELANGIASMSSYPSATILRRFLDEQESRHGHKASS